MAIPGKVSGEVFETLIADQLTVDLAAIRLKRVLDVEEGTFPLADPPVLEFRNTPSGRVELKESSLPENWINAVMLIWGDEPTQEDEVLEPEPDPHPPYKPEPKPEETDEPDPEE